MHYISYIHLKLKNKLLKINNELFLRLTCTVDALKCGSALCCSRNPKTIRQRTPSSEKDKLCYNLFQEVLVFQI